MKPLGVPSPDNPIRASVLIVGGGFSGTLTAVHLARAGVRGVVLIERGPRAGLGVAYGTACPSHLLNVPAGKMSALPDEPTHFVDWLREREPDASAAAFARRSDFGLYLRDLLGEAERSGAVTVERGEAVRLARAGDAWTVELADGRRLSGGTAVLATGNPPPAVPRPFDALAPEDPRFVRDPWADGSAWLERLRPGARVVVVGTGLTMLDVAMALEDRGLAGPERPVLAVSRRGLLPRYHGGGGGAASAPVAWPAVVLEETTALGLLRAIRRAIADCGDWRAVIDATRPVTNEAWVALPEREKRRVIDRLAAWWDVHRHRCAPSIGERIDAMLASGTLRPLAVRRIGLEASAVGAAEPLRLSLEPRGGGTPLAVEADVVVNCTGPRLDIASPDQALLAHAVRDGLVALDPLGLGLRVDAEGRALDPAGRAWPGLLAIGPLRRGTLWETTAVPEIRVQAQEAGRLIAERLAAPAGAGG